MYTLIPETDETGNPINEFDISVFDQLFPTIAPATQDLIVDILRAIQEEYPLPILQFRESICAVCKGQSRIKNLAGFPADPWPKCRFTPVKDHRT